MGQQMNEAVRPLPRLTGNVRPITRFQNEVPEPEKRFWLLRFTNWIGITMARTEDPRGFSFNPATITLALVVGGGILTGGYLWGENVTERRHLLQRVEKAEDDARRAAQLAAAAAGQAGHANTNTGGH